MSHLRVEGCSNPWALHGHACRARPASFWFWARCCPSATLHLGSGRVLVSSIPVPSSTRKPKPRPKPAVIASLAGSSDLNPPPNPSQRPPSQKFWARWQSNAAEMRAQVAKLGLAAVLAYGLFDGVTYTTFFFLAFLGYEKSTGKNPAANIQALLGIVILMWTGNNVTRPLRVAGAAALAPLVDRALQKIQKILNLPNQVFAFMVVAATFAGLCLSVVGLLILSRWGK